MAGGRQRSSDTRSRRGAALPVALGLVLLTIGLTFSSSPASAATGWELILDRPTPRFQGMDFVSNDEGWLVAGGGILHTTDGGATWQEAAKITAIDVDFADASHGWTVGLTGSIYGTADGGRTWIEQVSGTDVHLREVFALSATEAFAAGSNTGFSDIIDPNPPRAFLRTTDGGATWQQINVPPGIHVREITFLEDHGWAAGRRCSTDRGCVNSTVIMLRTSDRGQTWTLTEQDAELTQIADMTFLDETNGWARGSYCGERPCRGAVIRTTDSGVTWAEANSPPANLISLVVRSATDAWALAKVCEPDNSGCAHWLYNTTDGGEVWSGQLIDENILGSSLYATDDALILPQSTLRSLDGGSTWQPMQHPALRLWQVDFADANVGYGIEITGGVFKTMDAGRTWKTLETPLERSEGIITLNRDAVIVFGTGDVSGTRTSGLFRTDDGGKSWVLAHEIDVSLLGWILEGEFADANHGWIALSGSVLFTEDGGVTWRQRVFSGISSVAAADMAGPNDVWIILPESGAPRQSYRLLHSTDGGFSWEDVVPGGIERPQHLEFVDANHGWYTDVLCVESACNRVLFATSDGGATWQKHVIERGAAGAWDLTFVDPMNGWISSRSCSGTDCTTRVLHTADGGHTWQVQLPEPSSAGEALLAGTFDFIDAETGWFLLDPNRGIGIGGGPPPRMLLYSTTDSGGGPIGVPPTPTVQLPNVGGRAPDREPSMLPLALLLSGAVLALGAGGLALPRRRSRG